jgi:hypothetical protein
METHYGWTKAGYDNTETGVIKKITFKKEKVGTERSDQCNDVDIGGKIVGAFSTSHSMVSALPAMSLNSAPGLRERINVAALVGR